MLSQNPQKWLHLKRIVRFGDTDAAGVIHFYQLLRWCHEAWEESLQNYGLDAFEIFPGLNKKLKMPNIALPIIHCQADFLCPIKIGDSLSVELEPERIDLGRFQVKTRFIIDQNDAARAIIQHAAIDSQTRKRCSLPEKIHLWLEASSLQSGPKAY